jgi:predicted RNase H-like nuclease
MSGALGLDGAAGGWVGWHIQDEQAYPISIENEVQLLEVLNSVELAFIDIPIGLADAQHERVCDQLLRQQLKLRKSSVFPCPSRAAVYATNYLEACELNTQVNGKKLSKQSWNICNKIRQIDSLLCQNPDLMLRESHPEYMFQYLNDNLPLHSSKKTNEGIQERLNVIQRYHPHLFSQFKAVFPGHFGKLDDWVDAGILAIAASLAITSGFICLPDVPSTDARGLTMAIHLPVV